MPETIGCEQQVRIFAALSDPVRLRIVRGLTEGGERSGSAIAEAAGISLALLCHHTRILVEAGVLSKRKEGQTAYFSLDRHLLKGCMSSLLG